MNASYSVTAHCDALMVKKRGVYGLRQEKQLESVGLLLYYPESNLLQQLD